MDDDAIVIGAVEKGLLGQSDAQKAVRVLQKARAEGMAFHTADILIQANLVDKNVRAQLVETVEEEEDTESAEIGMAERRRIRRFRQVEDMRESLHDPRNAAYHAGVEIVTAGVPGAGWLIVFGGVTAVVVIFAVTIGLLLPSPEQPHVADGPATASVPAETPPEVPAVEPEFTALPTSDEKYDWLGIVMSKSDDEENVYVKVGEHVYPYSQSLGLEQWEGMGKEIEDRSERTAWARMGLYLSTGDEVVGRTMLAIQKAAEDSDPDFSLRAHDLLLELADAEAPARADSLLLAAEVFGRRGDRPKAVRCARKAMALSAEKGLHETASHVLDLYGNGRDALPQPDSPPTLPPGAAIVRKADFETGLEDDVWYGSISRKVDPGPSRGVLQGRSAGVFKRQSRIFLDTRGFSEPEKMEVVFNCFLEGSKNLRITALWSNGEPSWESIVWPVHERRWETVRFSLKNFLPPPNGKLHRLVLSPEPLSGNELVTIDDFFVYTK